jgi:hypothetical protein
LDHRLVIFPTMENGMLQPRSFEYNVLYVTMGDIQSSNWMIKNSNQNHKIYFYLPHNWMTFIRKHCLCEVHFFTLKIVLQKPTIIVHFEVCMNWFCILHLNLKKLSFLKAKYSCFYNLIPSFEHIQISNKSFHSEPMLLHVCDLVL